MNILVHSLKQLIHITPAAFVMFPAVMTLTACGGGHGGMDANGKQMMTSLYGHAADLENELDAHAAGITAAANLPAVMTEENRHDGATSVHMGSMSGMMGMMPVMCQHMGSGTAIDTLALAAVLEAFATECERHRGAISAAADIGNAQAEEIQHQANMSGAMPAMQDAMDDMMAQINSMDCGM